MCNVMELICIKNCQACEEARSFWPMVPCRAPSVLELASNLYKAFPVLLYHGRIIEGLESIKRELDAPNDK